MSLVTIDDWKGDLIGGIIKWRLFRINEKYT